MWKFKYGLGSQLPLKLEGRSMIYSIYTCGEFLSALPAYWSSCLAHRSTDFNFSLDSTLDHECLQLIPCVGKSLQKLWKRSCFPCLILGIPQACIEVLYQPCWLVLPVLPSPSNPRQDFGKGGLANVANMCPGRKSSFLPPLTQHVPLNVMTRVVSDALYK